jgi:MoxR-like ATPase
MIMTDPYLDPDAEPLIDLPARGSLPKSVYVIEKDAARAINAALATGRPLLVRGEPGTGKSGLARAAAERLKRVFVSHVVDARTETRDLLWSVDHVQRLAEAQLAPTRTALSEKEKEERLKLRHFVRPGPLWWAFDWDSAEKRGGEREPLAPEGWRDRGAVVLIDELDKAPAEVPSAMLDALGQGSFEVPDCGSVAMSRAKRPLILITTNEERALPDAFLRRCWVLHLALPEERKALHAALVRCGRAHFKKAPQALLDRAAELLARDRAEVRERGLTPPGMAEYIDLVRAVSEQKTKVSEQLELLELIGAFALQKHPREPGS